MRWDREVYDPILKRLHKRGMIDRAITEFMLDQHLPVSFDDVRAARRRLGLEANRRPPVSYAEKQPPLPRQKENPLEVARHWLGARLTEKPSGYFLDGVPVNLTQIMREVNRMRVALGVEQITCNPAWLP